MHKTTKVISVSILLLTFCTINLSAQQWTAEQREVWKNVEAYWALASNGDLEGYMSYFHPDYLGWYNLDPMPLDKAKEKKWYEYGFKTVKTIIYVLNPVGIKIYGDIAFAHYYYTNLSKDSEGKEKLEVGRWTDILMKQGEKWLIIGDHGGPTSED